MSTPNDLTQQAKERFLSENRDLIALINNLNQEQLFTKIAAAMQLNPDFTHEVMLYADIVGQKGLAGRIAREDFSRAIYEAICKSFLKIQRNCMVTFATRLTPEATAQLEEIEVAAGERQPAPPPPPAKSQQELLTEEVKHDWAHLGMDKIRKKFNNPAYKKRFDELINELPSQCTSLYDAGVER